jgi:hypothetical protein
MRISANRLLPARSLDRTAGFYAPLGFRTLFREDVPGGYLILRRDAVTLSFVRQGGEAAARPAASFHINVEDVDRCHADWGAVLVAAGAPRLGAIHTTTAGREFALVDLDGTSLRVSQRRPEAADGPPEAGHYTEGRRPA